MTSEDTQSPTTGRSLLERGRRILGDSRIVTAVETVADKTVRFVRNSSLYNWLTAEPEPEVIVIDLRETYTIGPFIRVLDWAIEKVRPWYRQSVLKRGVDAVAALGERAAETRAGQLLIALLEPPEPPAEDETERNHDPSDDRRTE